jgi:hypothetical protein
VDRAEEGAGRATVAEGEARQGFVSMNLTLSKESGAFTQFQDKSLTLRLAALGVRCEMARLRSTNVSCQIHTPQQRFLLSREEDDVVAEGRGSRPTSRSHVGLHVFGA